MNENGNTNKTASTAKAASTDETASTANSNDDEDNTKQEYIPFFPELNLSPEEDDFLHDVMVARLEFHERHALHSAVERIPQEDRERFSEASQAFEALMQELPHEDSLVINRYCDTINTQHAFEVDGYYKDGLLDGFRLARLIREV